MNNLMVEFMTHEDVGGLRLDIRRGHEHYHCLGVGWEVGMGWNAVTQRWEDWFYLWEAGIGQEIFTATADELVLETEPCGNLTQVRIVRKTD